MPFPTREELIAAGKWQVVTVDVPEVGPVRLAKPSAASGLRINAMKSAGPAPDRVPLGQDAQSNIFAEMLRSSAINSENRPLFDSLDAARNALDALTAESVLALIKAIPGATPEEAASGNSTASRGAGSPSGSV